MVGGGRAWQTQRRRDRRRRGWALTLAVSGPPRRSAPRRGGASHARAVLPDRTSAPASRAPRNHQEAVAVLMHDVVVIGEVESGQRHRPPVRQRHLLGRLPPGGTRTTRTNRHRSHRAGLNARRSRADRRAARTARRADRRHATARTRRSFPPPAQAPDRQHRYGSPASAAEHLRRLTGPRQKHAPELRHRRCGAIREN